MSVCVYSVFGLSCVQAAALRRGPTDCVKRVRNWKSGQGPKGCRHRYIYI
jgi:hypothetical protein